MYYMHSLFIPCCQIVNVASEHLSLCLILLIRFCLLLDLDTHPFYNILNLLPLSLGSLPASKVPDFILGNIFNT